MLCVCFGILEIGALFLASLLPFIPFLRRKLAPKKCEHTHNRKRIPYVTSADVVKMKKKR
jgi:hypothetical protein